MTFGLSTSWNAFRYEDGAGLIFEIKKSGFAHVELGFNLTAAMVGQIEQLVQEGQVKVLSLHNFCPIPEGMKRVEALPDCYSMASLDQEQRRLSVAQTKTTIETARRLGAAAVVLHAGRVDISDRTRQLMQLYASGQRESRDYDELLRDIIQERSRCIKPFLENTLSSLDELSRYAAERGIGLGIENRIYYREIPTLEEIGIILNRFGGRGVRYWHDTGHAQIMEHLGFARHRDYLERYGSQMLGIHLHDVSGCRDHLAPSKGELKFEMLAPYLKRETIKIIESHYPATAADLGAAVAHLTRLFPEQT